MSEVDAFKDLEDKLMAAVDADAAMAYTAKTDVDRQMRATVYLDWIRAYQRLADALDQLLTIVPHLSYGTLAVAAFGDHDEGVLENLPSGVEADILHLLTDSCCRFGMPFAMLMCRRDITKATHYRTRPFRATLAEIIPNDFVKALKKVRDSPSKAEEADPFENA